jgi:DNA repair protein RadC
MIGMMAATRLAFADPAFTPLARESDLVGGLVRPHFTDDGEWLTLFCFDAAERLIAACENGGRRRSSVNLTPAMVRAVVAGGACGQVLVAHNHPSGELRPSDDDIRLTRQLVDLGRLADFRITDHLILTQAGHFSFRAAGLL